MRAGGSREGLEGACERERSVSTAMRVAAGRRARSRALEGGVRERMSARGGTRRVCAGGTGRAVRVCACARCACPAVLKDTSGRRRRSRCPGDVTARPSDNRPVPEPSADTRGGSCGGGSGDGRAQARPASRSWEPVARSPRTLGSRPAGGARGPVPLLCGVPAPSSQAAACGVHGHRRRGGNGRRGERRRRRPRSGRRRQRPPGTGNCAGGRASSASGSSGSPRLPLHPQLEHLLAGPWCAGRASSPGCKKRLFSMSEHRDSFF